jgi:diguanylate cyclase (GGDEF)-like protein
MKLENSDHSIILIVDDTPANLAVLSDCFDEAGFEVWVARDGASALRKIEFERPDLILLDVLMPRMDGFETCQLLKQDPAMANVPVIFMTALADIENRIKGLSMGAVDYITKPFQIEEVLVRVTTHLKICHLTRALEQKNRLLQQEIEEHRRTENALQAANQELQRLAGLDSLTQIANRRRFEEYLDTEWRRHQREGQPLGLILSDIDYFKQYNDAYGHQLGDECLQQIAQTIKRQLKRPADLVARYGGEEFVIVLPNTDAAGALSVAKQIQSSISNLKLDHAKSEISPFITLSLGVTSQIPTSNGNPKQMVALADRGLYEAKKQGRNRAVLLVQDG